ncbi:MAG: NAD-dependent epimerase/dehydratase family protein [Burkholderiaceae bacterium]|nr:MAG: NAD-dependent epimerase/dehydratase family protein [Burkholderiaceae bacterium]
MLRLKVCVTGASGFIGRRLVERLCVAGFSVRVISRRTDHSWPVGVEVLQGDLSDPHCPVTQLVKDCAVVFHCAGEIRNVSTMRGLHVEGTRRLLTAALNEARRNGKPLHWVQLSSVGVYGPPSGAANAERVVTEDSPLNPVGEYEITKLLSDALVLEACTTDGLTCSIVRPSNVFGANLPPGHSLHALANAVKRGAFFFIGKPNAVATYVHVDDVVELLCQCATDVRARNKVFNLSNDCLLEEMIAAIALAQGKTKAPLRLPEFLARLAAHVFGGIFNLPLTQKRIGALVSRTHYPCDKLARELGFTPRRNIPLTMREITYNQTDSSLDGAALRPDKEEAALK